MTAGTGVQGGTGGTGATPGMRAKAALAGLLGAAAVSLVGTRMSAVTLPWLVLVTTGSPTKMGLIAGAEMLPYVVTSALGPPLVDRIGARRASISADIGSTAAMLVVAAAARTGFLVLIGLVAVAGVLRGFGDNAKRSMVSLATDAAGASKTRVSSIYDGFNRLSILIGAPIAGLIIAWVGISQAIVIDAASFAVAAVVIGTVVNVHKDPATAGRAAAKEPYFTALRGGIRYLREDRLIGGILGMLFAINLFNQASVAVFIPLWVKTVLDTPAALGVISGALALGAVLGNIGFTIMADRMPRYVTFAAGFLIGGAPRFLTLAFSHQVLVVVAVTFVSGLALSSVNPIIGAMIMERTPRAMQARVFGLATAVAWAGIPLGGVLGGMAVRGFGLTGAIALAGFLYLAVALTPVVGYREWRKLDDRPPAAQPEPVPTKA